jgi:hypothetical protein
MEYKDGKVRQKVDYIDLYCLEGSPKEAVQAFKHVLADAAEYYGSCPAKEVSLRFDKYADGASSKAVLFSRFYLKVVTEHDEDGPRLELQVWGERLILPEEQAALDADARKANAANSAHERAEYERLKKVYEPRGK